MTHHTAHRPLPPTAFPTNALAQRATWSRSTRGQTSPQAQRPHNQKLGTHQGGQKQP